MASPFQQQSRTRKLIYLGVIIALFTGAWALRRYSLEPQAHAMAALEQNTGEVQLNASALRLSLTGTRGVFTCMLWMTAIDKQKKHEWNELEVYVGNLTKLQPHFMTPWLFQSWNLAYNVSAECDRVNDKYFYVTRGIELLAEGERQNSDNPDMRYWVGFYTQHKVHQSDETNVFRSLLQLGNISPNDRDPNRFWAVDAQGARSIDLVEFEQFCKDHPQLVRRLQMGIPRETKREDQQQFKCATPEAVVQFLADNRRVPSVFQDMPPEPLGAWTKKEPKLRAAYDRFPLLPPPVGGPGSPRPTLPPGTDLLRWQEVPFEQGDLNSKDNVPLKDHEDAYLVGRAWYGYAMEPVPPPDDKISGETKDPQNRVRQRKPKQMAAIIFRHYPARAQSFSAERMQAEGWFDEDGWEVPNWFGDKKVVIGANPIEVSRTAWEKARSMWEIHGHSNHLLFPNAEAEDRTGRLAAAYARSQNANLGANVMPPGPDASAEVGEQYEAYHVMVNFKSNLLMTNFAHHYHRARVEAEPTTVMARKLFNRAEARRLTADLGDAVKIYEGDPEDKTEEGRLGAIRIWRDKVLLADGHKDFRRDDFVQEETYEVELKYLELVNEQLKLRLTRIQPFVPLLPKTSADVFTDWILTTGPFDINDKEGQPLITDDVRQLVQGRHKIPGMAAPPKPQVPDRTR